MRNMQGLFEGLKVIELASVLAGPAVGTFFSELGAEVVKVENKPAGGDVTRQWRVPEETSHGPSAYYASVNWNKQSLFLDLADPVDKQTVLGLIADADIVISNFKKGDDIKFGLSYEDLKSVSPGMIYGAVSGFGSESDRLAYDLILQAETGFMSMNGQKDSPPTKMPLALIDLLAAHQLKEGILCAMLKQKDQPDTSQLVTVSLYDSAIASLINQATNWLMNGNIPGQTGSLHPNIAPYGEVFRSQDGKLITVAVGSNEQFENLCRVLGLEELCTREKFTDNTRRVEHRSELADLLGKEIRKHNADTLIEKLHKVRVPVGEIKNLKQVFSTNAARELLLKGHKDGRETLRPKTAVFKLQT